ncbi:YigZ family protein [Listeria monocytogenes]|uniref:YigZ family protein n=1 Tax=Listeria monocytogenes TaxID=1639 RepID=UPI0012842ED6|nr:YigZ family protein [Listeria monocytogenes]EAW7099615.1 YigZ family protein [Listeria monocytogenes]EBD1502618.1 YigZ family protein [Listeria monocytogenes]ECC0304777.1 YigZ family protein [Listeria monocytogenes]ECC0316935.1 YigZ family protein [Listeria monocytogenes]ECC1037389.1 YigZ family protein [Listeria monocytogenes]
MLDHYLTIHSDGKHEIIIEKSRFICHIKRATTETEAQTFIQEIKKEHRDATHNCSAYIIGENDQYQKAHDDGEPSGTAGVPMLEILKKKSLKNVAVVVTRYFGGTKLGAGGLVRAYGSAVSEAIQAIGIVECKLATIVECSFAYPLLGKVENALELKAYQIDKKEFTEKVVLHIFVDNDELQDFSNWITEISNGQLEYKEGPQKYREKDVT